MVWVWEQFEWPHFRWSPARMSRAEEEFRMGAGIILGAISHLNVESRNLLTTPSSSPATARRDLADMVDKGALTRTGERRHTPPR